MYEAIRSIASEDVTAGRTRVSADHRLLRDYPSCFRESAGGPPDEIRHGPIPGQKMHVREGGGRRRTATPRRHARLPLDVEDCVRRETLVRLDADDRIESTSGRRSRQFWEGAESLLRSQDPATEQRLARERIEDAQAQEATQAIAWVARAELDRIDELWREAGARWN